MMINFWQRSTISNFKSFWFKFKSIDDICCHSYSEKKKFTLICYPDEKRKETEMKFFFFRNLTGIEYILLHVQEPILYVIRKQHRHSPNPTDATPLADYYIIAGVVYQAPDLSSVINSRLVRIENFYFLKKGKQF